MLEQAYRLWGLRSKWKGGAKLEIPDYHSEGSD